MGNCSFKEKQHMLQRAQRFYEMQIYKNPICISYKHMGDELPAGKDKFWLQNMLVAYGTYIVQSPVFPTNIFPDKEDVSLHNGGDARKVVWVPITELKRDALSSRLRSVNFYDEIHRLHADGSLGSAVAR
jgi:hypothetical protein